MELRSCHIQTIFAGIVFFLYKAGESMLDATIRPYIVQAVCKDKIRINSSVCYDTALQTKEQQEDIQSTASIYLIYYRILINVPAIILGLVWGAWSDRHGRKLPMMVPSLGSVFAVFLYVASLRSSNWTLVLVLCGAALQGIFGKSSVITMAVNSYVSDITDQDNRTGSLSRLLAMSYFGLFLGSLLSGTLQEYTDIQTTFTVVCVLHACSVITTIIFIKDVDPASTEKSNDSTCRVCTPTGLRDTLTVHLKNSKINSSFVFASLVIISLLNQTCKVGDQDVTVLFVKKFPLEWPASWYGYLMSMEYMTLGFTLLILAPLLSNQCNVPDSVIAIVGICCKTVRMATAGFCTETWMVFMSVLVGAIGGMLVSAVRAMVSKNVEESEIGKAFAVLACAESISKILGSVVFNYMYGATVHFYPGLVYIIGAALYLVALILAFWLYRTLKLSNAYDLLKGSAYVKRESVPNE